MTNCRFGEDTEYGVFVAGLHVHAATYVQTRISVCTS